LTACATIIYVLIFQVALTIRSNILLVIVLPIILPIRMITLYSKLRYVCMAVVVAALCAPMSAQTITTDSIFNPSGKIKVVPGGLKSIPKPADADTTDDDLNGLDINGSGVSLKMGMEMSLLEHPCIELSTGPSSWSYKDISDAPQTMGNIQISSGTLSLKPLRNHPSIARSEYDRVFVQLYDPEYRGSGLDSSKVWLQGWRFGFHLSSGYTTMHNVGGSGATKSKPEPGWSLLHTGGLVWSFNTFGNLRASADSALLKDLESYRFGTHAGAMIRYNATSALSLSIEAERTMMFNDYSFFGWAGSALVEGLAQSILSGSVIKSIERKSPGSVAIAAVFLRSALSYGIYELRRGGQHFPFSGNKPMISDAIRIGIGVSF
jgi:hypothetical protein